MIVFNMYTCTCTFNITNCSTELYDHYYRSCDYISQYHLWMFRISQKLKHKPLCYRTNKQVHTNKKRKVFWSQWISMVKFHFESSKYGLLHIQLIGSHNTMQQITCTPWCHLFYVWQQFYTNNNWFHK